MNNKIIIFSNIKGGCGKTCLSALFASYLAERSVPVIAADADLQASLHRHRQREVSADPDAAVPYNIEMLSTGDANALADTIAKLKEVPGVVLVDCPGNLNDKNLELIYKAADAAIIPMTYDADTVDATGIFIRVFKTISNAPMLFLPNRINSAEKRVDELRQRTSTIEFLSLVGEVLPQIKQSVAVKRYTTLYSMDSKQIAAVEKAFGQIIETLGVNTNNDNRILYER